MNRRELLQWLYLSGFLFLSPACSSFEKPKSTNRKPKFAFIGCGYQGQILLKQVLESKCAEVTHLCDADSGRLQKSFELCKSFSADPKTEKDWKDILGCSDIDAVIIVTPNFWHTPMALSSVRAGYHVFLEKPVSHTFEETFLLSEAQKQSGRFIQAGTNLRSSTSIREGIQLCKSRPLSEIEKVVIRIHKKEASAKKRKLESEIDWTLWNGASPPFPRSTESPHYVWHFYWNYGEGHLSNFGVHLLDLLFWILEGDSNSVKDSTPIQMKLLGNRVQVNDDAETPNLVHAAIKIGNLPVFFELISTPDIKSLKKQRTLTVIYKDEEVEFDLDGKYSLKRKGKKSKIDLGYHILNFARSLEGKEQLNCPIEKSLLSTQLIHAMNLCYKTARGKISKSVYLQEIQKNKDVFQAATVEQLLPNNSKSSSGQLSFVIGDLQKKDWAYGVEFNP
ncbi:MAG: Gfo/Idh/MocA family protein [Pseudobdellovibrionaceae bacterium]